MRVDTAKLLVKSSHSFVLYTLDMLFLYFLRRNFINDKRFSIEECLDLLMVTYSFTNIFVPYPWCPQFWAITVIPYSHARHSDVSAIDRLHIRRCSP